MITEESYKKEWILSQTKILGKADPNLVELTVYAFILLEQLIIHKLDFVFKGGTSLMLLLPDLKRFSTDIDILSTVEKNDIEKMLEGICKTSVFSRWELDDRRSYQPGIPKAHYKLFFISNLNGKEKEIMLDILIEKHDYPELIGKDITLPWLKTEGTPFIVSVPTVNAILGDKLCAFAPNTIGVPHNAGKDREIVKQLFDINLLMAYITNVDIVSKSFKTIAVKEISYKENNPIVIDDVYKDIRSSAFMMAYGFRDKYASDENRTKYYAIESGRAALKSFIVGNAMISKEAILLAASQAAYITTLIQFDKTNSFALYDEKDDITKYLFTEAPESILNRLLKLQGGILYYLKNIYSVTKQ
jgi:hypothetical protein